MDRDLDVCRAGGVEILGLHATVAPERQNTQTPPVLERQEFVPCQRPDHGAKNPRVQRYINQLLREIQRGLKDILDNGLKETLVNVELLKQILCLIEVKQGPCETYVNSDESNSFALMDMLSQVFAVEHNGRFLAEVAEIRRKFQNKLGGDVLMSNLLEPEALNPSLAVVLENQTSAELKVVELHVSNEIALCSTVAQFLSNQIHLRSLDYTVATRDVNALDAAMLESLDVKAVAFDAVQDSVSNVPQINSADLLILSDVLHNIEDSARLLWEVSSVLRPGGFVLLKEPTRNLAIPCVLHALTAESKQPDTRRLRPFHDEKQLLGLLGETDLDVVQSISDDLSSMLLCRYQPWNMSCGEYHSPTLHNTIACLARMIFELFFLLAGRNGKTVRHRPL